jgi:hypothetical protein
VKKLYLAKIDLRTSKYMSEDGDEFSTDFRLVWAYNENEAKVIVTEALRVDDPYGVNTSVEWVTVNEALGTP